MAKRQKPRFIAPKVWSVRSEAPAEIIAKLSYLVDGTGRIDYPVFELLLTADENGFKFLSRYFAERAKDARRCTKTRRADDDHAHLESTGPPFNAKLSDRLEIRTDCLTKQNRKYLFEMYGISSSKRRSGSMAPHLRTLAYEAERQIREEATNMKKFLDRERAKNRGAKKGSKTVNEIVKAPK